MRPFLTARWQDLLLVTWTVPDALLQPHLPPGLVLDRHGGHALVSLVAFDFSDTRVLGVRWPGYTRFPELNLRFYVREGARRGVCFVREYVPGRLVAGLARLLYNEPYVAVPYRKEAATHVLEAGGRRHRIGWRTEGALSTPPEDSLAHFLKEHSWGFGQTRGGTLQRYEVEHPVWRTWERVEPKLDVDLGLLYGEKWAALQATPPLSVIAAEGSAIRVFPAGRG
jgi:uncharacterized protein